MGEMIKEGDKRWGRLYEIWSKRGRPRSPWVEVGSKMYYAVVIEGGKVIFEVKDTEGMYESTTRAPGA